MTKRLEINERARELARASTSKRVRADSRLLDRLEDNDAFLRSLCERLLAEARRGRRRSAAATWLLDNYSYIHSQARDVREALPKGYLRGLPCLASGELRGFPRVYRAVAEIVALSEGAVRIETVREFLGACQRIGCLTLAELWAVPSMLRLAVIEELARAAEAEVDDPAVDGAGVRDAVVSLRTLDVALWREIIESVSRVERILRRDPSGHYAGMEFESRDAYRHAVEQLARGSERSEEEVARLALDLAWRAAKRRRQGSNTDAIRTHVGFYLVGPGVKSLKWRLGFRAPLLAGLRKVLYRCPSAYYLGAIALGTALVTAAACRLLAPVPWWAVVLLLIPSSQAALLVVNSITSMLLSPRRLPRMDFSEGIPADCRSMVVVPTLLISRADVEKLLEDLEIRYLANRDPNLLFALLTDFPDSPSPCGPQDQLLEVCAEGIRLLNERYASQQAAPFYLFHRNRDWNEREGVWMGQERKRGKLEDLNLLLLYGENRFDYTLGELPAPGSIRYVITLDSDTQLPRDTAHRMIGTMAHPLNRPKIDEKTNTVREGYALAQPRVSISMESAGRSYLAQIYSGRTGFDPYTTAVSDLYQDLYGQATFTGKGIYDVRIFDAVAGGRFPDNSLLSHDLIEGEHVRTGLMTDLEVIDDYPSSYDAYCRRKHRWTRGDWQLLPWLLPRVPDRQWRWVPNPLSLLSRWKIFDNLRRSLVEPAFLVLMLAGWCCLPGGALLWTLAALALLVLPAYAELGLSLARAPRPSLWGSYLKETAVRFGWAHLDALLTLTLLAHQSCLMADAIARTLVRRLITGRKLLEWQSMAQVEQGAGRGMSLARVYLLAVPLFAWILYWFSLDRGGLGFLIAAIWMGSPLAAGHLDQAPPGEKGISEDDRSFLRDLALRTWRYFHDFAGAAEHWLIPDNVQEDPPQLAPRISPTNLGLQLTAELAAHDFGYLTARETAERVENVLASMGRLARYRGHFYNWYDTRTLEPLGARYVSTVDSGNLAASLLVLKQGCLEMLRQPIIDVRVLSGLQDHCRRVWRSLPAGARTATANRLVASLRRQLEYRPGDLFFWEGVLEAAKELVVRLGAHLEGVCERLAEEQAAEVRYWQAALLDRAEAALADLRGFAPWLGEPFEPELRFQSTDRSLSDLMTDLCRVPALRELPQQYERIERHLRERLESGEKLLPATRDTLWRLLGAVVTACARTASLMQLLHGQAERASEFVGQMQFGFLFHRDRKLLRVGFDVETGTPEQWYYDLLATEARTAVFLAIAKGDVPREAWFHLGRKLTAWRGKRALLSWSGTMFEYLLPQVYMRTYKNTLLDQSLKAVVRIQQQYAAERRVPWGISESACNARDSSLTYQYEAFGIPALRLKRASSDDLVIAPYATLLALGVDATAATANLRLMASKGWLGKLGFYDAVDFTPARTAGEARGVLVRGYMAHHQAMGLLALDNLLLESAMHRRFHLEPLVQATDYLLQERVPALFDRAAEEEPLPVAGITAAA